MHNVLVKVVCITSASLAAHSNVIEELQKFRELQNTRITINYLCIITQPKTYVIHIVG